MRQWVLAHLKDCDSTVELLEDYPHLAIYDDQYSNLLHQDLNTGKLAGTKFLLCLSGKLCDSYMDLFRVNVRHIIYPGSPFATEALRLAVNFCRGGAAKFSHNTETVNDVEHYQVQAAQDYTSMQNKLVAFLQVNDYQHIASNARMVLREALTNAIFHSFREEGNPARKYAPETFLGLYDCDVVEVTFKATPQLFSIKVRDSSGGLGPLSVANSLDRQRTEQGILDARGRGFFLMRHMSHRMIINVHRGVETVLELFFLRKDPGPFSRHMELLEK